MIKIVCGEKKGFRRGGAHHVRGENFYPEDHFSKEQLAQIEAEAKLVLETGLKATAPGLLSEAELHECLEGYKIEFLKSDPRELLVKRLKKAIELAGSAQKPGDDAEVEADLIKAARQAIEGGAVIASGAPEVGAIEEILGRSVTAAERNQAWDAIQAEG